MEICSNLNRNYTAEALNKSQNSNLMMYPIDCQLSEWNEWSDCSGILEKKSLTFTTNCKIKNKLINVIKLDFHCVLVLFYLSQDMAENHVHQA